MKPDRKICLILQGKLTVTSIKTTSNITSYVDHIHYTLHEEKTKKSHPFKIQ